jgi:23S rRNA (uridine2552-2'-O)-methyltransferase
VGPKGRVVGLDLQPVSVDAGPNTVTFVGDAFNFPVEKLRQAVGDDFPRAPDAPPQPPFDVVLSDMAPNTTGTPAGDHLRSVAVCRRVLEIVPQVLRPGGDLVMKIFEGEAYMDVVREAAALFREAKGYKPPATREVSREMFILAFGYKGAAVVQGPRDPGLAPRRVAPGPGWGGAGGGGGGGRA